jgi:DNA-binding transcriptional LysR family regulator
MTPFRGRLRIRHLEIVLAIADFGSLSKASVQLDLTQSGLSRAITEIEEIVGGRLFERTGKGMACTPLGDAMCRHAQSLLGDLDKAENDLGAVASGNLGSLALGCFSLFSSWPLADAVRVFRGIHPRVAVSLQVGMHDRLMEDLDSSKIDLLVSRRPPTLNPEIYRATDLMEDSLVLACAPAHPLAMRSELALGDCVAYPWIAAPPKNRVRVEVEARLRQIGCPVPDIVGALSLEFCLEMIEDGHYLCMLPCSVARFLATRRNLHVLPVDLALVTPPLAAIWRRERASTRQLREFVSVLGSIVAAQAPPSARSMGG